MSVLLLGYILINIILGTALYILRDNFFFKQKTAYEILA